METNLDQHKKELNENGFSIVENCFNESELNAMINFIRENQFNFAERQLLNRFSKLQEMLLKNHNFNRLYNFICDKNYFLSKAIYFNKVG